MKILNLLLKFNKQTVRFKTLLSFCDRASEYGGRHHIFHTPDF
jgi:hypothetical protein